MFDILRKEIKRVIDTIGNRPVFKTTADKNEIKNLYLLILNEGEPIVKVNKTYTCNACMSFLNKFGSIIWFDEKDKKFVSIWDKIDESKFKGKFIEAIKEIRNYMSSFKEPIEYAFFQDTQIGIEENTAIKEWNDGRVETLTFKHLYGVVDEINIINNGGFNRYYRLNEAKDLVEKAKKLNKIIEKGIAERLIKEVPQLNIYKNSLNKVEKIASINPYEKHIERKEKLSNLLLTALLKTEEDEVEEVVKFLKTQTRPDKFMQEKAKDEVTLMREYNELQKKGFIFTGLEVADPTFVFEENIAKRGRKSVINPVKISREDFLNILKNQKIYSIALLIKEEEINKRKAVALKQKTGETEILKQPVITIYETGYTDALWQTVKKHGGNINAKYVFSLIFGQPCYSFEIDGRDIPDLDLHCKTPEREIFYGTRGEKICGLELDVDMKVHADEIKDPIENIFGDNPADGKYLFYVEDYTNPDRRGKHFNNFKIIAKMDGREYETEIINMNKKKIEVAEVTFKDGKIVDIKWFVPLKSNSLTLKDMIKTKFEYIPVKTITNAGDQILFDIGLDETFKTTGINKEYLNSEYQKFNQVIKLIAEEIDARAMIGYKNYNNFVVELNGKYYIVE